MRKVISILLLCIAAIAHGQQQHTVVPISSFMSIPFDTAPDEAARIMASRKAVLNVKQSKKGSQVYTNVTVGGMKAEQVFLRFVDEKFFEGGAFFNGNRERAVELYHAVKRAITLTYGEGVERSTLGEGNEIDEIERGRGTYVTTWVEDVQANKRNTIELSIEPDLSVLLKFRDVKAAGKKKK